MRPRNVARWLHLHRSRPLTLRGSAVQRDAVLRTLRRSRYPLPVSAIASRTGSGSATVRETLLALQAEGLVRCLGSRPGSAHLGFWELTQRERDA